MILSNVEILNAIHSGRVAISPLAGDDPAQPPFNTSSIDLRLGNELLLPKGQSPIAVNLMKRSGIAAFLHQNSTKIGISEDQPYSLKRDVLVLGQTLERVDFPIHQEGICYSARVEGRSSLARCGILVHFTAPTIHAGFNGTIALEIINLGPFDFLLTPGLPICQLIIEEVKGTPVDAPNQFRGQNTPSGLSQLRSS